MHKLVVCSVGTSISNGCQSQGEMLSQASNWNDDVDGFLDEIRLRVEKVKKVDVRNVSAEINSLDRLGIGAGDKVILLASDNAAGKACAQYLQLFLQDNYGLSKSDIVVERIEGLQVYDSQLLKTVGLKNFIAKTLAYVADKELSYQYDIIINPTGGFKGVIPFLTIVGMLYGKRIVYIFEFAKELIFLPPLPVTFDIHLFNRVRPALDFLNEHTAAHENEYLSKIVNFVEAERDLFLSFVEEIDGNQVTTSPLADCFLELENNAESSMVLKEVYESLINDNSRPALALKRLINKSQSPLWRNSRSENWHSSDLIVLRQDRTAERVAGFIKDGKFYVTHAFRTHEEYELKLHGCFERDYLKLDYVVWKIVDSVGEADENDDNALLIERDNLLSQGILLVAENEALQLQLLDLEERLNKQLDKEGDGQLVVEDLQQKLMDLQNRLSASQSRNGDFEKLEQEKAQLESEQIELHQMIEQLREAHKQHELERSSPWWKRIFK